MVPLSSLLLRPPKKFLALSNDSDEELVAGGVAIEVGQSTPSLVHPSSDRNE